MILNYMQERSTSDSTVAILNSEIINLGLA